MADFFVVMPKETWDTLVDCNQALQAYISEGGGEDLPNELIHLISNIDWAAANAGTNSGVLARVDGGE